jgi:hypothetical protein
MGSNLDHPVVQPIATHNTDSYSGSVKNYQDNKIMEDETGEAGF